MGVKSLSSPSFFNSSRDEKVGTTQAGPEPNVVQGRQVSKTLDLMIEKERQVSIFRI